MVPWHSPQTKAGMWLSQVAESKGKAWTDTEVTRLRPVWNVGKCPKLWLRVFQYADE